MEQTLWGHLPLLVRSASKDSVEHILQALWRTRKTGLDAAERELIREMLQLPDVSDLDPLLVCLRILIRRSVYEDVSSKDEIERLFPEEVLPELRRLLTLLLQKFQREWREEVMKNDQVVVPRLKTVTLSVARNNAGQEMEVESSEPATVIGSKLAHNTNPQAGESELQRQ